MSSVAQSLAGQSSGLHVPLDSPRPRFITPAGLGNPSLRAAITAACRRPEHNAVAELLPAATLAPAAAAQAQTLATRIASTLRQRAAGRGRAAIVQGLLQEYALSSEEGVALMCLAEALLRIPDAGTRQQLIRDKISRGAWQAHLGRSESLFVNAASWGLLITGKLAASHSESGFAAALLRLVDRGGEPLIRKAVELALQMMGEQFVTGETIEQALRNGQALRQQGYRYSYDMLGEAAMTMDAAERYLRDYENAIHVIGRSAQGSNVYERPGISIKLSALHPRYSRAQYARVMHELYPVLLHLCALAKQYDIGLNIDAEEADRLEISLDLLERLCFEPSLVGWSGLGFVVQAYQKRCPSVIDYLVDLARRSQRRLMVRLVKGAYWDAEIKKAQVDGQAGYPVYTRKHHTDVAYLACARKLLDAPESIYPQFATHNAHTLAAVHELAGPERYWPEQYEFQCLHGMGEPLYEQVVGSAAQGKLARPCRIYAPVGSHETLLAYLVRRLLENGANSSFINRIADHSLSIDALVRDPVQQVEELAATEAVLARAHPLIPLPRAIYGETRLNPIGLDLADEHALRDLADVIASGATQLVRAMPLLAADIAVGNLRAVSSPANADDVVGYVRAATRQEVDQAIAAAAANAWRWAATPPSTRAERLLEAADRIEAGMPHWIGLLMREAGKTAANAVAEVREAVDFLRYYALQVRDQFDAATHVPLGPVVCISPWNFPLAIFLGQVAAALAAGNVVLAKPAEQTPLVAAEAVRVLWSVGVPRDAVQLLTGDGSVVGAQMVNDPRVMGVLFTGSTEVARILQRNLVGRVDAQGRPIPLIAETGGQNAMIVDSSALLEQVVGDVLASGFDSAGQRCSALRVLCVQEDSADALLAMLTGAMEQLVIGHPAALATDVGPVIDTEARDNINRYIDGKRGQGRRVHQLALDPALSARGSFVAPTLVEIHDIAELGKEIFGPVVHVLRYRREDTGALIAGINATGYGLTMGLHTRIDAFAAQVAAQANVGNLYINRNMVGAVVGVQPFGGEGLSGTGPKAGGPLYVYRLLSQRPDGVLRQVFADRSEAVDVRAASPALIALTQWAESASPSAFEACRHFAAETRCCWQTQLPGPTGERNCYSVSARAQVLCLGNEDDLLIQLAAVLAVGARAIWPPHAAALRARLPAAVADQVMLVDDETSPALTIGLVLLHGNQEQLVRVQEQLARRTGAIVPVIRLEPGELAIPLERMLLERAVSTNTAAAGGNASLLAID